MLGSAFSRQRRLTFDSDDFLLLLGYCPQLINFDVSRARRACELRGFTRDYYESGSVHRAPCIGTDTCVCCRIASSQEVHDSDGAEMCV